jgi:hypothetical protein
MGAWVKVFKDGTSERGSDLDIINKKASWSKGRLKNIVSVSLFDKNKCCVLSVSETDWYQYDRYMAMLGGTGENMATRVARIVQARLQNKHLGKKIQIVKSIGITVVDLSDNIDSNFVISKEHIGQWITIYLLVNGKSGVIISEKGAFNGDEQIFR